MARAITPDEPNRIEISLKIALESRCRNRPGYCQSDCSFHEQPGRLLADIG